MTLHLSPLSSDILLKLMLHIFAAQLFTLFKYNFNAALPPSKAVSLFYTFYGHVLKMSLSQDYNEMDLVTPAIVDGLFLPL